jgi:hypothetical protein
VCQIGEAKREEKIEGEDEKDQFSQHIDWREAEKSRIGSFQDFFPFFMAIDKNGALLTDAAAQGFLLLPDFVTRGIMKYEGGAILFQIAIKDIPAWRQLKEDSEAGKGEPLSVEKSGDLSYLINLEVGVYPVIGPGMASGFDEPPFFVVSDSLLGKGDV